MLYFAMLATEEEKETFATIYKETRFACYRAAIAVTKNHAMAEDAVHQAFVSAIKKKEEFFAMSCRKRKSSIVIYTKNATIDLLRAKYERDKSDLDETNEAGDTLDLCDIIGSVEGYKRLTALIKTLPEIYRTAFELRYVQDLSNQEIAAQTGISNKAVSKRIERAKHMLRKLIIKEDVNGQPTA